MIHLEEVTENNWREDLCVSEGQKAYVSDSMKLLARAYVYRNKGSYACIIYNDKEPVGMALYYDFPELQAYDFSQLFIDYRYQGKGYGKIAANLILERMRREKKYENVIYHDNGLIDRTEDEIVSFWHNPDPYSSSISYSNKKAKSLQELTNMLIKGEAYADTQAKNILLQTKPMSTLEAAFRHYKSNPSGYNPGQSNYVQLVKQKGAELMSSPEIQSWMRNHTLSGKY